MESTIGFMLHGFKNPSFCPAVILYDEVISDNPEGGTGKGLFMEGLNQMKKMVKIDGKHFDFTKSFPYQLVSADTQIIVFDDVTKNFKFERLFSVITEGLTLEKKNQDAIKIGFDVSPKIGITTNYAIKGTGNSFARRKWELEMHPHYTMKYSPLDEFKKMMFTDWDDEEFCCFDNFNVSCLQGYLNTGLIKSSFVNSKIRDLIINTSHEFVEWCGEISGEKNPNLVVGKPLMINDLFNEFTDDYPDYSSRGKIKFTRQAFRKWLEIYGRFWTGSTPNVRRSGPGNWIEFAPKEEI